MRRWTDIDLERAKNILSHFKREELASAVSAIGDLLKAEINYDELRGAFRRRGLGPLTDWCLDADEPVESEIRNVGSCDLKTASRLSELERILVVPDCHHPYIAETAWRVMLAAARVFAPHRIIVLGDFGDFYATNRHRKDPNRESQLEHEIGASNRALDELDALGALHKHFIFGNHEDNLSRFLADHAPALFNMVKVEALFRLEERGWTWTPYGQHYQCGKVFYAHDPSGCGAQAHIKAGVKYGHPIVHGHTHRASMAYYGNATGEKRVCIMAGWLGDCASATYVHDVGKQHEWMHSFLLGWKEPDGVTHFHLVPVISGRACVNGQLVKAA